MYMYIYIYIYIAEKGPVVNALECPEVSDLSLSSMQDSLRVILACVISALVCLCVLSRCYLALTLNSKP